MGAHLPRGDFFHHCITAKGGKGAKGGRPPPFQPIQQLAAGLVGPEHVERRGDMRRQ